MRRLIVAQTEPAGKSSTQSWHGTDKNGSLSGFHTGTFLSKSAMIAHQEFRLKKVGTAGAIGQPVTVGFGA
ncbi:hypothetical protein PO883_33105 [Massilia sp. DJPM01]|uniref:hypothetical protein n=1 Tax=Massilia sp. DJPM01 TaxID=3024404 RepID=UPI00259F64F1|nr:hypothetical protein [Massilia sp. DJPM01]MDM5182014.1 hypothetical protein [Massilia sp. DJPM01]